MDIDRPEVVAEVRREFERYEQALVTNDGAALDGLFRDDPRTIRYGGGENLYGHGEIKAFRAARSPAGLARTIHKNLNNTHRPGFRAHDPQARHHLLWARFRDRLDAVSARQHARKSRPPDADLGALPGRLARGRGACE